MANSLQKPDSVEIYIPEAIAEDNITLYIIHLRVGRIEWTVRHRYREFVELHESLIEAGVDKDALPTKKYIGNRDPGFIMKRRKELEAYLQSVFNFLRHSLPQKFIDFICLPQYDLHYVLRNIAAEYHDSLEAGIHKDQASWSPIEIHAISERLKAPRPPEDTDDQRHDFVNVADFACQLTSLTLTGNCEKLGDSNIIPNELKFDFLAFKCLTTLTLIEMEITEEKIGTFAMLRNTLVNFEAARCALTCISELLLCDAPSSSNSNEVSSNTQQKVEGTDGSSKNHYLWKALEYLNLRDNNITVIDRSINLAPELKTLYLGSNSITCIENIETLSNLSILELSNNKIEAIDELHTKLGQITRLDLDNNKIRSLVGCSKLYSLEELNVSTNKINDMDNVLPVSKLPCLESLNLQGNHVTTVVDYRLKVFEAFGKRCSDLCLDNELPSQQEVDKVSVLMALRIAREGKSPTSLFGNLPRRV